MYFISKEEFVLNSLAIFGKTKWDIEYLRDIESLSNKRLIRIEDIYHNEHVTISKRLSHNSKVKLSIHHTLWILKEMKKKKGFVHGLGCKLICLQFYTEVNRYVYIL